MWRYNTNYLSHGNFKYLDKYMSKNGKWVYVYEDDLPKNGQKTKKSTLNEEGKQVAKSVKEQINDEKDEAITEEQERHQRVMEVRRNANQRTMEQHRTIMNQRITSIQNLIKRMPPERKQSELPKLKYTIQKLREDNDKKRASIQAKYKSDNAAAVEETRDTKQTIRKAAKKTYQEELEKIRSNSRYIKAKKS